MYVAWSAPPFCTWDLGKYKQGMAEICRDRSKDVAASDLISNLNEPQNITEKSGYNGLNSWKYNS